MHEPTHAALLAGVIGALRTDVLPAVEGGAAHRQLKAALVVLGRLQRAADQEGTYLDEEAADLTATLGEVLDSGSDADAAQLAQRVTAAASDVGTDLRAARARDAQLQALAIDVERHVHSIRDVDGAAALRQLHRRMLARQDVAWGTAAS